MKIHFLGAARQVTGSRYLLEAGGLRLMIDCGMFQERAFLSRNWEPPIVPPDSVTHLLLTHAHLDHCGLIPRFVRDGFHRRILTTSASRDLAEIILRDAAQIQEEDAAFKRRRHELEHRSGAHPEAPLYTAYDVTQVMPLFQIVHMRQTVELNGHVRATYFDAGHILGSAMIQIDVNEDGEDRTVLFSGDIGQWGKPIIRDPSLFTRADYVVMESTYGGKDHQHAGSIEDQLAVIINDTIARGGNVVVPTFAVERAQELVFYLRKLTSEKRIPHLMVFLDSPMALDAMDVFLRHREAMDPEALRLLDSPGGLLHFSGLRLTRSASESKAINRIRGSCIILASSGMCTAGRIKHHLARNISRPESTILFTGYQAQGTLGREIIDGNKQVRILGQMYEVKAKIAHVNGLSAHADHSDLMRWVGNLKSAPRKVFLTHGEVEAAEALKKAIVGKWSWPVEMPEYRSVHELP